MDLARLLKSHRHNIFRTHRRVLSPGILVASAVSASATHTETEADVVVKITPNEKGNPPGKLADAELYFTEGVLDGLKLIGFGIWERRGGNGRNVTFPARQYSVNGERRTFALLRPIQDATAQNRIREVILEAFAEYEANAAVAV
jgi:hypothetical protein